MTDERAQPMSVLVPIDLLRRLRDAANECAEDLAAEIAANYRGDDTPTGRRRLARDIEPTVRAFLAIGELDQILPPPVVTP